MSEDQRKSSARKLDPEVGGVDNNGFEKEADYGTTGARLSVVSNDKSIKEGEVVDRQNWDSPLEFLLSCISMSVGLGNIWRFPYTAYKNGGGAFIIPYLIVLVVIGRPIYFLEMSLGQFASYGPVKIWTLSPFFKGIGYIGMLACVITLSFYCSIIAITIYYFIVSFQTTLPWTECLEEYGKACVNCTVSNCPQFYFSQVVVQEKASIDDGIGLPNWQLTLCLAGCWIFIFFSLIKGVQSSGKVAYFTALFPYVVLIIFLVRGVTLPGSLEGIRYFIEPQWEKIYDPTVWYAAVGQCFFSLGTGTGPITMFSSYNPFRHTAYRDALIISLMDTFTSLLAGFSIFAVLGHLAFLTGEDVSVVATGGPGLVFVSYPRAIATFEFAPQLFSVLFFLMLFTLGIGSANALAGAPITILMDQFPSVKKWQMTLGACIAGFLSGLMYVTPGGQFMVTFMDYYGAGFLLYFLCTAEVVAVAWFYGLNKFIRDIEFMLGIRVGWYWIICWGTIIPIGLVAVLIYAFATATPLTNNGVEFPTYVTGLGWAIAVAAVLMLPAWGLHAASKTSGSSFSERVKNSFLPKKSWGPRAPHFRKGWEIFKTLGEMTYNIPVGDNTVAVKVRGVKERVLVTPEVNAVTIRVYNLSADATINESSGSGGLTGFLHSIISKKCHTWKIIENTFENFHISVESGAKVVNHTNGQKMYNNDYVITIKF